SPRDRRLCRRAGRGRCCGIRQGRRISGASLVLRLSARGAGASKLASSRHPPPTISRLIGVTAVRPLIAVSPCWEVDRAVPIPPTLSWLSEGVVIDHRLGTAETTAIVHLRKFTSAVMSAAQQHGTELRRGQFTGVVSRAEGPNAGGIEVDGNV